MATYSEVGTGHHLVSTFDATDNNYKSSVDPTKFAVL